MQIRWAADSSHLVVEDYGHLSSDSVVGHSDLSLGNMRTVVPRVGRQGRQGPQSPVLLAEHVEVPRNPVLGTRGPGAEL